MSTNKDGKRMCDVCEGFKVSAQPAVYDALLPGVGTWADVCQHHFEMYGCETGLGKGSRLNRQT